MLGGLALFSTSTGDAWMLDFEDGLALCLARDGVKQDYMLIESSTEFRIGWEAEYEIDGEAFTVVTREGRVSTIIGYPTDEILATIREARKAGGGGWSFPGEGEP